MSVITNQFLHVCKAMVTVLFISYVVTNCPQIVILFSMITVNKKPHLTHMHAITNQFQSMPECSPVRIQYKYVNVAISRVCTFLPYMWLSEQKPDMFAHKLKFILLPQLIATLNNYACSLPPLANVYWSAFLECFLLTMKIHYWGNGAKGGIQFGFGDLILHPMSAHICLGLVVECWP